MAPLYASISRDSMGVLMRNYEYHEVEWWLPDHSFSSPIVYVGIIMAVITIAVILREMNK